MENKKITVVVDAMGGENAPYKNLKGSEIFLNARGKIILENKEKINKNYIFIKDDIKIIYKDKKLSLKKCS